MDVESHIMTCGRAKHQNYVVICNMEDNKILTKSYETYFIEKFKTALNKRHK